MIITKIYRIKHVILLTDTGSLVGLGEECGKKVGDKIPYDWRASEYAQKYYQTMIDSGNTVRRRLFNKYTNCVESVYQSLLSLAKEHWKEKRLIQVLGSERAYDSREYSNMDIAGGFDIMAEYGASLSLDPARRREEIQQLKPDLIEAGMSPRSIVQMYRLNELDTIYDRMSVGRRRQQEIFDEIIDSGAEVEIAEMQDHQAMLEYAYEYLMSAEFKHLKEDIRQLIETHVKAREQMSAQSAAQGQAQPGEEEMPAGPAGPGGPELAAVPPGGGVPSAGV